MLISKEICRMDLWLISFLWKLQLPVLVGPLSAVHPFSHPLRLTSMSICTLAKMKDTQQIMSCLIYALQIL